MADVPVWALAIAAAPGILALGAVGLLQRRIRALAQAQRVLLPDGVKAGLLERQTALARHTERLETGLGDLRELFEAQGETTERELARALRFQGLVRYDAYRDMGGGQSWSLALLDSSSTGTVITCLHARDHARMYLKQLTEGRPAQRLSPEEQRAVTLAIGRPPEPAPPDAPPEGVDADPPVPDEPEAAGVEPDDGDTGRVPR